MTDRISTEDLQALLERTVPGPWQWTGSDTNIRLTGPRKDGRRFVMTFARQGMGGAQPLFNSPHGMIRGDELVVYEVNRDVTGRTAARADGSVYRRDIQGISHPDARLIELAPALAAEVLELREKLAELERANPVAWEGYWPGGGGSISSKTMLTDLRRIAQEWEEGGAVVTPLYARPPVLRGESND